MMKGFVIVALNETFRDADCSVGDEVIIHCTGRPTLKLGDCEIKQEEK